MSAKILIFGAGVIGSTYATRFSNAGFDVTMLARGSRLKQLNSEGLLYHSKNNIQKSNVKVISELADDDLYDFVFITVRFEQVIEALNQLASNQSKTFVTMVNTPHGYAEWEKILGQGRLIAAFPGAGGEIRESILYYKLTPYIIQPTTFGELNGLNTQRIKQLSEIFKAAKIPYQICHNMDAWQKTHLAMVMPMAMAVYNAGKTANTAAKNKKVMNLLATELKANFQALKVKKVPITPKKLNIFIICPKWLLSIFLKAFYRSKLAERVISDHANNAKHETLLLQSEFNKIVLHKN